MRSSIPEMRGGLHCLKRGFDRVLWVGQELCHASECLVGKYELGERRLDWVELVVIAKSIKLDPIELLRKVIDAAPEKLKEQGVSRPSL